MTLADSPRNCRSSNSMHAIPGPRWQHMASTGRLGGAALTRTMPPGRAPWQGRAGKRPPISWTTGKPMATPRPRLTSGGSGTGRHSPCPPNRLAWVDRSHSACLTIPMRHGSTAIFSAPRPAGPMREPTRSRQPFSNPARTRLSSMSSIPMARAACSGPMMPSP